MRCVRTLRAACLAAVAGAALIGAALTGAAVGQMPDNTGLDFDIEDDPSPAIERSLEERDRQDRAGAREEGGSDLPMLWGPTEAPAAEEAREEQPEPRAEPRRSESPAPAPAPPAAADDGEGLGLAIGLLFEQWNRAPAVVRIVYRAEQGPDGAAGPAAEEDAGEAAAPAQRSRAVPPLAAGTGLYGRVLYGVSSDYPGPVLLEVLQRPLAGAVLRGQFEVVRERLVLRFSSLEYRGERVQVEAFAVDPDCACYGVEGEVDRHFFERVLLPAALAFGQGYLEALSSPASTISTVDGDLVVEQRQDREDAELYAGAAGAARALSGVLLETAPRGPTVTLARDTELVVVFTAGLEGAAGG